VLPSRAAAVARRPSWVANAPHARRTLLRMAAPAAAVTSSIMTQLLPLVGCTWLLKGVTREFFANAVVNQRLYSAPFSALGYSWRLVLQPKCEAWLPRFVGVFPELLTDVCKVADVNFVFRCGRFKKFSRTWRTSAESSISWGCTDILSHGVLLLNFDELVPGGVLTLRVSMYQAEDVALKNDTLAAHLGALLASGDCADVTLVCADGERMSAHAALLCARSPVFAAQLRAGPMQAELSAVPVPPEITAHTMNLLLRFLSTDVVELESAEEATHVLNAADHYGIARLFATCELKLCAELSVSNAAETLTLADQHAALKLKHAALMFVAKNALAVMATPGWAHLQSSRPALITEAHQTLAAGSPPPP